MDKAFFLLQLQKLNAMQRLVVDSIEGPVMVIAGPGTGKTQLLSMRVANILDKTLTSGSSILCLTFTDNAAYNMRQRLQSIIGSEAYKVAIHTFHSFGTEVINQNPHCFFFGSTYRPADNLAKVAVLENILVNLPAKNPLKSFHPDLGWTYLNDIQSRIKDLKEGGLSPADFKQLILADKDFLTETDRLIVVMCDFKDIRKLKPETVRETWSRLSVLKIPDNPQKGMYLSQGDIILNSFKEAHDQAFLGSKFNYHPIKLWKEKYCTKNQDNQTHLQDFLNLEKYLALADVYEQYQQQLHRQQLYDFEDMLLEVVQAFKKHPELKYTYQEKFEYILIDEFQDTNGVQLSLVNNLINLEVTENHPNIMVVGDDDQAIFKFQKATLKNIQSFSKSYKDPVIVTLTENYRSNQEILDFADSIISIAQTRLASLEGVDKKLKAVK